MRQARSLRESKEGLQACEGKLIQLGMKEAPRHSTLVCHFSSGDVPPINSTDHNLESSEIEEEEFFR